MSKSLPIRIAAVLFIEVAFSGCISRYAQFSGDIDAASTAAAVDALADDLNDTTDVQDAEIIDCADGTCGGSENCSTCPDDCGGPCCGQGGCQSDFGEDKCNCPQDCGDPCLDLDCGEDGCGGECGTCSGIQDACIEGQCVCQPDCEGKECGDDGCVGSCGTCADHFASEEGTCVYQPWCGDDVCDVNLDENCSSCPQDCGGACGETCGQGICSFTACDGTECGDDGGGGNCGVWSEHIACVERPCACHPWLGGANCDDPIG